MTKRTLTILSISIILITILAGCGGGDTAESAEPAAPASADAALKITGNVANETGWTEEEVRAMETMDTEATNKDGETKTYTGVSINALLELAGVNDGATTVTYVADDGFTGEVTLAEVQGCADCIVSFRDDGGFRIIMPDFSSKVQIKGVVEIQIQ